MCGISGFISNKKEEKLINDLTQTLVHRGPDAQGWTIIESRGKYIHLGCCRLSIRGGVGANMPIKDNEGNVLVYNGEIFDQSLLNSKCKQKIDFKKEGDAKLLFQYLKERNDLSSINGMFSFAYWDSRTETLTLARDKLGIKPLVITDTANSDLVFSSELKSLLSFPLVQRKISTEMVHSILALGGPAPDLEIIDNVRPIKPGSSVSWKEGRISNTSFHTGFQNINKSSPSEISEFIELLSLVVEDHLMADVPVEVLLSGGLDSSLLSLIIKRYLNKEVTNHTLSFEEPSFDELTVAESFSNVLNNNLTSYKFTENEMEENVEEALSQMNYPVLDPSFVPSYYLSKKVSENSKAVLSGDGADELFGGYEWYRAHKLSKGIPSYLYPLLSKLSIPYSSSKYLSLGFKVNKFLTSLNSNKLLETLLAQSPMSTKNNKWLNDSIMEALKGFKKYDSYDLNSLRDLDMSFYLQTNILPKVDYASMKNSLEIRPPFLDERIIKFALSIDNNTNVSFFNTKLLLRETVKRENIVNIHKLKKHGFAFPISQWISSYGYAALRQEAKLGNLSYLAGGLTDYILMEENNHSMNSREMWAVISLHKWLVNNKIEVY